MAPVSVMSVATKGTVIGTVVRRCVKSRTAEVKPKPEAKAVGVSIRVGDGDDTGGRSFR